MYQQEQIPLLSWNGSTQFSRRSRSIRTMQASRPVFPQWVMEGTSLYEGLVAPAIERSSHHPEFIFMPAVQMMLNYLSGRVGIKMQDVSLNLYLGLIHHRASSSRVRVANWRTNTSGYGTLRAGHRRNSRREGNHHSARQ